jgi:SAM-dependent methyltransferase
MYLRTWLKQMLCQWQATSKLFYKVHIIVDTYICSDGSIKFTTKKNQLNYSHTRGKPLIPPGRLIFTEELRLSHESQIQEITNQELSQYECTELKQLITPVLSQWLNRNNLHIVELGPAFTTAIPEALDDKLLTYSAVDFSPPYLQKQQERLKKLPNLAIRTRSIISDTYDLQLPECSADLIVTSCHPPLVSASIEDKRLVLDKIHHILKPNGVFAIFPWYFNEQPQAVTTHLLKLFHVRCIAHKNNAKRRTLLILEKR